MRQNDFLPKDGNTHKTMELPSNRAFLRPSVKQLLDSASHRTSRVEAAAVRLPSGCWVELDELCVDGQFIGQRP